MGGAFENSELNPKNTKNASIYKQKVINPLVDYSSEPELEMLLVDRLEMP